MAGRVSDRGFRRSGQSPSLPSGLQTEHLLPWRSFPLARTRRCDAQNAIMVPSCRTDRRPSSLLPPVRLCALMTRKRRRKAFLRRQNAAPIQKDEDGVPFLRKGKIPLSAHVTFRRHGRKGDTAPKAGRSVTASDRRSLRAAISRFPPRPRAPLHILPTGRRRTR